MRSWLVAKLGMSFDVFKKGFHRNLKSSVHGDLCQISLLILLEIRDLNETKLEKNHTCNLIRMFFRSKKCQTCFCPCSFLFLLASVLIQNVWSETAERFECQRANVSPFKTSWHFTYRYARHYKETSRRSSLHQSTNTVGNETWIICLWSPCRLCRPGYALVARAL